MVTYSDQQLVLSLAEAWDRLEGRLDGALSTIKGISFREYRLVRSIADAPNGTISRVDLANEVQLTPSGATRALQPLEKLGYVATVKDARDARRALASLTEQGRELVTDASGVIDDTLRGLLSNAPSDSANRTNLVELLQQLSGHRAA